MGTLSALRLLFIASSIASDIMAFQIKPKMMAAPPSLPAIKKEVLPGEGWVKGTYQLRGETAIFDTWKDGRRRLEVLRAGTTVTLLGGLNEVVTPDVVRINAAIPGLNLNPGDKLLRYTERGEGKADFWVKGTWFTDADLGFVQNANGSGCQLACKACEIQTSQKIWWFHIRPADGRTGWTDSFNSVNPNVR
jgi:hypothetical protein